MLSKFNHNIEEIHKEIANMMTRGTRYINFKSSLGVGLCLVLDIDVAESMYGVHGN